MKLNDLFNSRTAERRTSHAARLYEVNVEAGFSPDDARRCADRDAKAGLYQNAFPAEDAPAHPHRDAPEQPSIPFDWPTRR